MMAGRPAVNMINTLSRIYDEIIRASQMLKSRESVSYKVSSIVDWCANRMVAIDETYVAALRQSMPDAEFSQIDTLYQQATERLVKKANQYRNATITVHDRAQEATDLYVIAKMCQRAMNMLSTAFYKKSAVIQAAKAVGNPRGSRCRRGNGVGRLTQSLRRRVV